MRDQLVSYIDLLFAGANDAAEIKQEILQNTLDRYDDLIDQGKSPESAYRLAISGIGDINELLTTASAAPEYEPASVPAHASNKGSLMRGIAVALYITCAIPLFLLQNEFGLCLLLVMVAAATCLMILAPGKKEEHHGEDEDTPRGQLRKSIRALLLSVTVIAYFALSFTTRAWGITWMVFPIGGALRGIVFAILDLKEAKTHEN